MQTLSSFSIPTPDLPPLDDSLILGLLAQQTSTRADNPDILAYFEKHADLASRSEFCRTTATYQTLVIHPFSICLLKGPPGAAF